MLDIFHKPCIVMNFAKYFIIMDHASINPFGEKQEIVQKLQGKSGRKRKRDAERKRMARMTEKLNLQFMNLRKN